MVSVSAHKSLRDKILRFFRENPDESLTQDDVEIKFNGAFCVDDVLFELLTDKLICYERGEYSLIPEKPKKKRKSSAWRPSPPVRRPIAPEWMLMPEPPKKPPAVCPPEKDVEIVQEFWARAKGKKSCELWGNIDTGEKAIFKRYTKPERCWMPLMRSDEGVVSLATNSYTFSLLPS